jgi:hypothetical protein
MANILAAFDNTDTFLYTDILLLIISWVDTNHIKKVADLIGLVDKRSRYERIKYLGYSYRNL